MKNCQLFAAILLFCLLFGWQMATAQKTDPIRQEVLNRLRNLKLPNTKQYVYKLIVPPKKTNLPENLRLDIVYKIGHYEYNFVALRFEKTKGENFVEVTRFDYGSALEFYKKYSSKGETYSAMHGKLAVEDFNKLLALAYRLYKSNIEKVYLRPQNGNSFSWSGSSCDGRIVLNLSNTQNLSQPIIKESGTLHGGELKERISNGYEDLRVHLLWEIFYDYLQKNNIFSDLEKPRAEEIIIARLQEPQMIDNYTDYFRQALYVEILGEIGTEKALPILKKLTGNNGLEKDWDKYLSEDALQAIEKIRSREKLQIG